MGETSPNLVILILSRETRLGEIIEVAQIYGLLLSKCLSSVFISTKKMSCVTFWATFFQTHPVTLILTDVLLMRDYNFCKCRPTPD
jgi:hypothetical protein